MANWDQDIPPRRFQPWTSPTNTEAAHECKRRSSLTEKKLTNTEEAHQYKKRSSRIQKRSSLTQKKLTNTQKKLTNAREAHEYGEKKLTHKYKRSSHTNTQKKLGSSPPNLESAGRWCRSGLCAC